MHLAPGDTLERYTIEALIGRGGMGEVYQALDNRLRRKVALKVVLAGDGEGDEALAKARLFREARAAAALTHPSAVSIHDLGETNGRFFIVMELVTGRTLAAFVGDDRVTRDRKLGWLADIGRALDAAHRSGVVHRDVKPSNVMITGEGAVKVLDFGLAKPLAPGPQSFDSWAGHVAGTPRYMAPEQFAGVEADGRSDQFSLGVLAYELLSGVHPGPPVGGLPSPLDEVCGTSRDIANVVARMLERSPEARFPTMAHAVRAIEHARARSAAKRTLPSTPPLSETHVDTQPEVGPPVGEPPESSPPAVTEPVARPVPPTGDIGSTLFSKETPPGLEEIVRLAAARRRAAPVEWATQPAAPAKEAANEPPTPPNTPTPTLADPVPSATPDSAPRRSNGRHLVVAAALVVGLAGLAALAWRTFHAGAKPAHAAPAALSGARVAPDRP